MNYTVNVKTLIHLTQKWYNIDITNDQALEIEYAIYKAHNNDEDYFIDEDLICDCIYDVIGIE